MMPTMQEIDRIEQYGHFSSGATFEGVSLKMLCAAARRGVEADAQIAAWKREELEWHNRHDKDRVRLGECESQRDAALQHAEQLEAECAAKDSLIADWYGRARKAEAELAAIKVERDDLAAAAASLSADVSALAGERDEALRRETATAQACIAGKHQRDGENERPICGRRARDARNQGDSNEH